MVKTWKLRKNIAESRIIGYGLCDGHHTLRYIDNRYFKEIGIGKTISEFEHIKVSNVGVK